MEAMLWAAGGLIYVALTGAVSCMVLAGADDARAAIAGLCLRIDRRTSTCPPPRQTPEDCLALPAPQPITAALPQPPTPGPPLHSPPHQFTRTSRRCRPRRCRTTDQGTCWECASVATSVTRARVRPHRRYSYSSNERYIDNHSTNTWLRRRLRRPSLYSTLNRQRVESFAELRAAGWWYVRVTARVAELGETVREIF